MKSGFKLSNLFLIITLSLFSTIAIAQPAGSPVYYEGETYSTIVIGSQCWMTENLNVGTRINGVASATNNGIIEKSCFNDDPLQCLLFGGLYRWNELMEYQITQGVQGICPTGWHIPTDFEWSQLLLNYNIAIADEELIIGGSSGFDAVKGGYANPTGGFYQSNIVGVYFSSTKSSIYAYRRAFNGVGNVERAPGSINDGYSVRCMRNSLTSVIPFSISISGEDAECNGTATGSVSLVVSGTSNPSFIWSNGSTVEDLIGVTAGTYSVTVTEGTQSLYETYSISEPSALSVTASVGSPISCYNGSNGVVTVLASGGVPVYSYLWSSGQGGTSANSLSEGIHTVTVTDANGCESTDDAILNNPSQQVFFTANVVDLDCFNDNSGYIDISPQGAGPFLYSWSNYQVSQDINNISADVYSVTVTSGGNCTVSDFVVEEPDILGLSYQSTNPSEAGYSDGSVDISVTGGVTPFSYSWSNGLTTQDLINISAGNYFVTVNDANLCSVVSDQISLLDPGIVVTTQNVTDISCNGMNDGSIYIVASGYPPFSYTIGGPPSGFGYFGNLSAGNYSLTITDQQGGILVVNNLIVSEPAPIAFYTTQEVGCTGTNLTISATGGTLPYTYSQNGSTYQSSNTFSNLSAGNYTFYVKDNEGCEISEFITVNYYNSLSVNGIVTHPSCNGLSDGVINLTVSNGVSPIGYLWSNGETTQSISGLSSGNYWVTVSSSNGCSITESYSVVNPSGLYISLTGTNISTQGGSDGSIQTFVSGGTYPYSFSWSNGLTSQNIAGLTAGGYVLTITDNNLCTSSSSILLTEDYQLIDIVFSTTDITCNGGSDGAVEANPSGGIPPYSFVWLNGSTDSTLTGLSYGNYFVTVSDNGGNIGSNSVFLSNPAPIGVSVVSDSLYNGFDVSCFSCTDGQASVTGFGGVAPYSYIWSNGETAQINGNLGAGNYFVTVTDSNNCSNTGSINLTSPADFVVTIIILSDFNGYGVSCNGSSDGELSASITGGTPPFSGSWSTGVQSYGINNLTAGSYSVTVNDNNGLSASTSVIITQPNQINATEVITDVSFSGGNDGAISLFMSGGVSPFNFTWSTGATSQNINNLITGNYSVTISDSNSCEILESFTVEEAVLSLSALVTGTNVLCFGDSDGSALVQASNGTSPYTYNWSNGNNTESLFNLTAGEYFVTVFDNIGDSIVENILIAEPAEMIINLIGTNISISGGSDGSVTPSGSGGTAPYSFTWSNGATTFQISNLTAGLYSVTAIDANGCSASDSIILTEGSSPLELVLSGIDIDCFGDSSGEVSTYVTGGLSPYTYLWSTGSVQPTIYGLAGGEYFITVYDSNNDSVTSSSLIFEPAEIIIILTGTNISIPGGSDGSVQPSGSGGTLPFTFTWSNGATTFQISNLTAGQYSVTAIDANGCSASDSIILTEGSSPLELVLSGIDIDCFGDSSGEVSTYVTGGLSPYTYLWSTGSVQSMINGLSGGEYFVTVYDSNSDSVTSSILIFESADIIINLTGTNISIPGGSDGSVQPSGSGGTPPFTFTWSNGATTFQIFNLTAGQYSVTAIDANGCIASDSIILTEGNSPLELVLNGIDIDCFGNSNGEVSTNVTGGLSPYTYLWSTGSVQPMINGLSGGEYFVTVYDSNSDSVNSSIIIIEPAEMNISLIGANVSIQGGSDGSIQLSGTGGTSPYSFSWSNGNTTAQIINLVAGQYFVTAVDANGCIASDSITLFEDVAPLDITLSAVDVECYGFNNGEVSVNVTGGLLPYSYIWSTSSVQDVISGLSGGEYFVTVYDSNNDSITGSSIVIEPEELDLSFISQNITCSGGVDGQAEVLVSGGVTPYSYFWSNGSTDQINSNLSSGTYMVYVTDFNNCFSISGTEVNQPEPYSVSSVITNASGPGISDGSAVVNVTGNTAPYSYLWSNGSTISEATGLQSDIYYVLIMDANSCDYWHFLEVGVDISGCIDPLAINYNPDAIIDDGSCLYNSPDWSYNNTGVSHTILISDTTNILINNPISQGDVIGVFYDSLGTLACAGYAYWQGVSTAITAWGAQSGQNDGFQVGEEFQWKIFDASDNIVYDAQPEYYTSFSDSGFYVINGESGLSSLIVFTNDYQVINLPVEYSFWSTYIIPFTPDIEDVLADIVTDVIIVKDDLGSTYWPVYGVNLIGDIIPGKGYQIKMAVAQILTVEGTAVVPELIQIPMPEDFSILGYLRNNPAPISAMLSPIVTNIVIVKNSSGMVYWPSLSVDLIGNMNPGEGYQIKMSNVDTLVYPSNSVTFPSSNSKSLIDNLLPAINTGSNMTIGIPTYSWSNIPEEGEKLLVKNRNGEIMGLGVFEGENMAISVWGDDELTRDIDGMINYEEFDIFLMNSSGILQELIVNSWLSGDNTYKTNSISIVGGVEMGKLENEFILFQNIPNPFSSTTEISFSLSKPSDVSLKVFNIVGEVVRDIGTANYEQGVSTISFDREGLPSGLYLYKIESELIIKTRIMNITR